MFIVCGEILFDVFPAAVTPTGLQLDARIGGSPFNVAMGLARMGQPAAFVGGIGEGATGDRLRQALADEGIDGRWAPRLEAPVTLSLVSQDAAGVPSYAFYGERGADRSLRPEHLADVPTDAAALHVGSYAMVVEPTALAQRQLIERQQGRSLIAYDLNVRTRVEPDLGRWRDTLAWLLPRIQLLKFSDEDLTLLHPDGLADDLARQALAEGVALVLMTRGARGAVGWVPGHRVERPGRSVQVMDTVGAGDTFQAASLTWLAEHGLLSPTAVKGLGAQGLAQLLDFAIAAAALTCSRRGADLPRRAELP